ncbi:hypothetical protein PCE1_004516 [Barthelona sp. PCE]
MIIYTDCEYLKLGFKLILGAMDRVIDTQPFEAFQGMCLSNCVLVSDDNKTFDGIMDCLFFVDSVLTENNKLNIPNVAIATMDIIQTLNLNSTLEACIFKINNALKTSTFIAGEFLTYIDLIAYAYLAINGDDEKLKTARSAIRLMGYIQSLPFFGMGGVVPRILARPGFVIVEKKKKGKKDKKGKKGKKQQPVVEDGKQEENAPKKKKKEKKNKQPNAPKAPPVDWKGPAEGLVKLIVGHILECEKHPESTHLLIEKIDVGEAEPRTILSGLQENYQPEDLVGKKVIVMSNLKAKKLGGIPSHGMVVCNANEDHSVVRIVDLPAASVPGTRLIIEGVEMFDVPKLNPKKKVLERYIPDLASDAEGFACFQGRHYLLDGEKIVCPMKETPLS